jgi:protein TonB
VPLVYPALARQQRAEGIVELSVLIDEKGNVIEARLVKGAPGIGLNQAAIEHAKRKRYRPATKDGVPVKLWMSLLVKFELPR